MDHHVHLTLHTHFHPLLGPPTLLRGKASDSPLPAACTTLPEVHPQPIPASLKSKILSFDSFTDFISILILQSRINFLSLFSPLSVCWILGLHFLILHVSHYPFVTQHKCKSTFNQENLTSTSAMQRLAQVILCNMLYTFYQSSSLLYLFLVLVKKNDFSFFFRDHIHSPPLLKYVSVNYGLRNAIRNCDTIICVD